MSSDRELLELAAKAAGVELIDRALGSSGYLIDGAKYWNPLEDDGDAHRLAVALRLAFHWDEWTTGAVVIVQSESSIEAEELDGKSQAGINAATRRAIVRAAAEIGKAVP